MTSRQDILYRYATATLFSQALLLWLQCYPLRLVLGGLGLVLVLGMPYVVGPDGLPLLMYAVMMVLLGFGAMASGTMFVAQMAFYNRVSDPAIGGTYMTMLNTISNLGSAWPNTAALWIVGQTTVKRCVPRACDGAAAAGVATAIKKLQDLAKSAVGTPLGECGCEDVKVVNGFVVTVALSLVVGTVWYAKFRKRVADLQELPASAWLATARA